MSDVGIKRIAVLQRVCPSYRLPLFQALSKSNEYKFRFFIGDDLPNSKVKSAKNIEGIDVARLATRFVALGSGAPAVIHSDLFSALAAFSPDVIITEGESNLFSMLVALCYSRLRGVPVIHWSLGGLPGDVPKSGFRKAVRNGIRRRFDAYIVYSSFGKRSLLEDGMLAEKIFVAVNVPDISRLLERAAQSDVTKAMARERLGMPERFTVLYVGSMDTRCKRLDLLVDIAKRMDFSNCTVVGVGDGPIREELISRAGQLGITNLLLPGAVNVGIDDYYLASDIFVLPGRGGMVISEAMAFGLPVITYQADGTEQDLIENGVNGVLLGDGDIDEFVNAIRSVAADPKRFDQMAVNAKQRIAGFGISGMVRSIERALQSALG